MSSLRIAVTGAGGFVGRRLVARLLARGELDGREIGRLICGDTALPPTEDRRIVQVVGDIGGAAVREALVSDGVDVLFHLATVPGGAAEQDYPVSRCVNLDATMSLLETIRSSTTPPRAVYTSTIAVYGTPLPSAVDDATPCHPSMTYGVQKLMIEAAISDFTRKGWIDGRAVRLSGIVARPPAAAGMLSAYLSDIFTAMRDRRPFVCPVSSEATSWLLSAPACVENLLHAAALAASELPRWRAWNLPTQCLSMATLIEAIGEVLGAEVTQLVTFAPRPKLQAQFGAYPPIRTEIADRLGFWHDGSPAALVRNALTPES